MRRGSGPDDRLAHMSGPAVEMDRHVPALVVKIGRYPLHHGGVGVIRTLGRLGVPVYAITEDRFTPAAMSRYCKEAFVWPTTGQEDPRQLVDGLLDIGRRLDQRTLVVPTDEEATVLIAEHASELSENFLFPEVPPNLPRKLASKQGLYELCLECGVPTPSSAFPATGAEIVAFAEIATFPVVAKNLEAWVRRRAPVVAKTTLLHTPEELLELANDWGYTPSVILQDYIPREHAEDWIVHLYCDANSNSVVEFTGLKVRSWPPHAGMTACAYVVANPVLVEMTKRFCKQIGYRGIADLDWRFDRRDGQYKLLDFNPRVGAQFRLFESAAGIDVVRALHLDLTGRAVPVSPQPNGRRLIVENIDLPARVAYMHSGYSTPSKPLHATSTEHAWLAWDDPFPFLVMPARLAKPVTAYLTQTWGSRALRRRAERSGPPGVGAEHAREPVPSEDGRRAVIDKTRRANVIRESSPRLNHLERSGTLFVPEAKTDDSANSLDGQPRESTQ
jgi:D-aspartate ligase